MIEEYAAETEMPQDKQEVEAVEPITNLDVDVDDQEDIQDQLHIEDENTQGEIQPEAENSEESENINAEEFKQILQEWALEIQAASSESEDESELQEEEPELEPEPEPIIIETDYSEYFETLTESRPFLTTPFEEYTVTEGYCLMFFLCFVIAAIYHMIRRFV